MNLKLYLGLGLAAFALVSLKQNANAQADSNKPTGSPDKDADTTPLLPPDMSRNRAKCDMVGMAIISASWGIDPKITWALFGVESDFGNNIAARPNDGRGPMQVVRTSEAKLRTFYPRLAMHSVENCDGAFHFACAHLDWTAKQLGVLVNNPRNIVAYNSGASSARVVTESVASNDWYYLRFLKIYKSIGGK